MDLKRAIEIAREVHAGQMDKGGNPYIEHPLRLMEKAKERSPGESLQIVSTPH